MNKKWIILLIALSTVIITGIGGKIYMDKNHGSSSRDIEQNEQAQKQLSKYIVQNYEGVQKIDFDESIYNSTAGSWSVKANINEKNWLVFNFKIKNEKLSILSSRYDPAEFTLKSESNHSKSLDGVEVIYGGISE